MCFAVDRVKCCLFSSHYFLRDEGLTDFTSSTGALPQMLESAVKSRSLVSQTPFPIILQFSTPALTSLVISPSSQIIITWTPSSAGNCGSPLTSHLYNTRPLQKNRPKPQDFHLCKMGLFLRAVAPAPSPPLTPTSAAEQLVGLFQVGRSLERYVEEFVELAYLSDWSDACLIALFLDGLDENTIRFDEPDDYVSLNDTINLILYLNGSKFLVEEVQDFKCPSRPVLPETRAAWPVCQAPSSSAYPSSELLSCVTLGPHTSAGSRRRRRRKRKSCEQSPVSPLQSPQSQLQCLWGF
ncbi:hypothetical protein DPX16_0042 [Anabarilius grahami]|uniref:Retrotransposon gag domain-containing protein n=1 Tax=Anabarilius grahami TaxID=495550 RepID=A0A3N0Y2B8_ANAGA|nr:hypothetical protein DPX16_0042 [Anabarilius grahami]